LELQADQLSTGGEHLDARIGEVEALLAEGDRDSVDLADQMVRLMTRQIDTAEAGARVDKLRADFEAQLTRGRQVVTDAEQKRQMESLAAEFDAALVRADVAVAQAKYDALYDLVFQASQNFIEFWRGMLGWLYGRFEKLNMLGVTKEHFNEGVQAAQRDDMPALRKVCIELYGMLPREDRGEFEAGKIVAGIM
jgi:hypothetical protein